MSLGKYVAVFLAALSGIALADIDDGCRDVLTYSARNHSVETADAGVALKIYDQHCENDQVRSGTNFSAGLEAVIKAVPIKFSLGSGSTEERARYFCKTFNSDYKKRETYYRSVSSVVNETTNAWLTCKSLAGQGVLFRPKIAQTQIIIEVARTNASPASVQGVTYDKNLLTCSVPNNDASNKRVTADMSTQKTLSDTYWPITCIRNPQPQKNETVYPKVDISVDTTKGAFLLPVDADASFPYQFSSELQTKITQNAKRVEGLSIAVEPFVNRSEIEVYKCPRGNSVSHNASWMTIGCNGQVSSESTCTNLWANGAVENRLCDRLGRAPILK